MDMTTLTGTAVDDALAAAVEVRHACHVIQNAILFDLIHSVAFIDVVSTGYMLLMVCIQMVLVPVFDWSTFKCVSVCFGISSLLGV